MKKIMTWSALIIGTVVLIAVAAFFIWASATYGPSDELQALVNLEDIQQEGDALVFEPAQQHQNGVGIILYTGAKVEQAAYSYYAQQLMDEGYTVIIPAMRLNFALLSPNKADTYIESFSHMDQWVIGGHSLGGVAAAMYASAHNVDGLFFLGSYPSEGTDLRHANMAVLSLYAQYDGLTTREDIEHSKQRLPDNATFVEIKGGNHAQFGMYGAQKGDHDATISAQEQQLIMVTSTLQWLQQLQQK